MPPPSNEDALRPPLAGRRAVCVPDWHLDTGFCVIRKSSRQQKKHGLFNEQKHLPNIPLTTHVSGNGSK